MIYLDSAATSFHRPPEVKKALEAALSMGNPGRGGHRAAMEAAKALYGAREAFAAHFGASPERVCFFYNATTALNTAVKTLLPKGGRLLLSDMEHNALRRPALALKKAGVTVDRFNGYGSEEEIEKSFSEALKKKPDLAAFLHVSNICPQTLPVKKLCALARRAGVMTVIDCAQSGGHLKLDLNAVGADGFVFPSHKGLWGVPGAGILVAGERAAALFERAGTLMEGGSGMHSFEEGMPALLPERLEWGTPALPAILSASAGLKAVSEIGEEEIAGKISKLARQTAEGIASIRGLRLRGMEGTPGECGPLLFTCGGGESALAQRLYDEGICLREGYHCAPWAHETVGTEKTGGLRVSFSYFSTKKEIARFLWILNRAVESGVN
ncbi:MAG: aminotransferase class V-fold PLP-dependent enzyme [Clostridia bacterium]|nr:aminotransferase class V-fold PLP-dependent enzyme [Clostridia bacterium]